jgi:putative phage repressor
MFDNRLIKLREEMKKTKKEVADALGMPYNTYSNYESNLREPNSAVLIKIADFYNVSIDYLLGLSNVKSVDTDLQTACKVTGLSEKLISEFIKLQNIPKYKHGFDMFNDMLLFQSSDWSFSSYLEALISDLTKSLNANLKERNYMEKNILYTEEQKNEYKQAVNILQKFNMESTSIIDKRKMIEWNTYKNFEHTVKSIINFEILEIDFKKKRDSSANNPSEE